MVAARRGVELGEFAGDRVRPLIEADGCVTGGQLGLRSQEVVLAALAAAEAVVGRVERECHEAALGHVLA